MPRELVIRQPDDFHLHLRDGDGLASLAQHMPATMARAIIMPNLVPPVTTTEQVGGALAYRERVMIALKRPDFVPLMTLYLTDNTTPDEISKAHATGKIYAVKLYPAGATTNSSSGVTDIGKLDATLARMAEVGMPLLVHGETTDPEVDLFDREADFIKKHLEPMVKAHPKLKIVMEHITTKNAVDFVLAQGPNVAATITAHHLLFNRNELFRGGLRPHKYCLPVLKGEEHRLALVEAIKSGNPKFFLGTDSAPHPVERKQSSCCSAGCFTANTAMELYATAFANAGALDKLEAFASEHGATFYGLPKNTGKIRIKEETWTVPASYSFGISKVIPLMAGEPLQWRASVLAADSAHGDAKEDSAAKRSRLDK